MVNMNMQKAELQQRNPFGGIKAKVNHLRVKYSVQKSYITKIKKIISVFQIFFFCFVLLTFLSSIIQGVFI